MAKKRKDGNTPPDPTAIIPDGPTLAAAVVAITGGKAEDTAEHEMVVTDAALADPGIVADFISLGVGADVFTYPATLDIWRAVQAAYTECGADRPREVMVQALAKYTGKSQTEAGKEVDSSAGRLTTTEAAKWSAKALVEQRRKRAEIYAAYMIHEKTKTGGDVGPWLDLLADLRAGGRRRGNGKVIWRNGADVVPCNVTWLWDGRFPAGMLSMLAGVPGLGKSLVATDMMARVSSGRAWPDGRPGPGAGDCLMIASEDNIESTITPRLLAAGADLSRIHFVEGWRDAKGRERSVSDLLAIIDDIEDKAREKEPALIIIDPVTSMMGDRDQNSTGETREVLDRLVDLAKKTGAAIVPVVHFNKNTSGGGPAIYRVAGSNAWTAVPRSVWTVVEDPDDKSRRLFVHIKCNLAASREAIPFVAKPPAMAPSNPVVMWGEPITDVDIDELVTPSRRRGGDGDAGGERGPGPAVSEAVDFLRAVLGDRSRPAAEVVELADDQGISEKTLQRASKTIGVVKVKESDRWVWRLPD